LANCLPNVTIGTSELRNVRLGVRIVRLQRELRREDLR
jgi:hypothetical protein